MLETSGADVLIVEVLSGIGEKVALEKLELKLAVV